MPKPKSAPSQKPIRIIDCAAWMDGDDSAMFQKMSFASSRKRRPCDFCRSKRIRCDADKANSIACSACNQSSQRCTFSLLPNRTSSKAYAETLERRIAQLEKLLHRITPNANLTKLIYEDHEDEPEEFLPGISQSQALELATRTIESYAVDYPPVDPALLGSLPDSLPDETRETAISQIMGDSFSSMFLRPGFIYLGKSSGGMLASDAFEARAGAYYDGKDLDQTERLLRSRRIHFWKSPFWEYNLTIARKPTYFFPDHDLILTLSDLYFKQVNIYMPLLHRPTFTRQVESRLHLRDEKFGALVLVVCAIGSRYSDDPRALADGSASTLSNGYKWFNQIDLVTRPWLSPASLHEIQTACLAVFFIHRDTPSSLSWTLLGITIRLAQDIGVHLGHPSKFNRSPTVESELWKRAWWALIALDRITSATMGRPCAVQHDEFDVALPIECDDEYWETEDPGQAFKQPPGKPSVVTSFIHFIKLTNLTAITLRSLYRIKPFPGVSRPQYQEVVISSLDSVLNKWKEDLPEFLRWNVNSEKNVFYEQALMLHVYYYHLQILVHRPFIPVPGRSPSPLSGPSLSICTNAARLCCTAVRSYEEIKGTCSPFTHFAAFTSCVVLLLNVWTSNKAETSTDNATSLAYVRDCLRSFEKSELRWWSTLRLKEVLTDLVSFEERGQDHDQNGIVRTFVSLHRELSSWAYNDPSVSYPLTAWQSAEQPLFTQDTYSSALGADLPIFDALIDSHMWDYT